MRKLDVGIKGHFQKQFIYASDGRNKFLTFSRHIVTSYVRRNNGTNIKASSTISKTILNAVIRTIYIEPTHVHKCLAVNCFVSRRISKKLSDRVSFFLFSKDHLANVV